MSLASRRSYKKRITIVGFIGVIFLASGFFLISRYPDFEGGLPFKVLSKDIRKKSLRPLYDLKDAVNAEQWNQISSLFKNEGLYNGFAEYFDLYSAENSLTGGILRQYWMEISIGTVVQLSKDLNPNVSAVLTLQSPKISTPITIPVELGYDDYHRRYLIIDLTLPAPFEVDGKANSRITIPTISKPVCPQAIPEDFQFISLEKRIQEDIVPAKTLGNSPILRLQKIPQDYYGTDALTQSRFPKRDIQGETFNPGWVISGSDANEFELGSIFRNIFDGFGTQEVADINGQKRTFPTGFFLDNWLKRVIVMNNENEEIIYYPGNQWRFSNPYALTLVGDFIFILDKGDADNIKIVRYYVDGGKLRLSEIAEDDFGLDLDGAKDISGYESESENVLLISDAYTGFIYEVLIDKSSGHAKSTHTYKTFETVNGDPEPIGVVSKMEITPTTLESNSNVLMCLQGTSQISTFRFDRFSKTLKQLATYNFPQRTHLTNLGYNLGERSFYVADNLLGKVHIFSEGGEYLGAGGKFGMGEENNELYYPTLVSTNNFNDNAIEMVVASEWSGTTGFKRFFPKADLGQIDVIEKAPVNFGDVSENTLLFRFGVTSGYLVDSIKLLLNGKPLKTIKDGIFANYYAETLLVSEIKDLLNLEWNHFKVEMYGQVPGPEQVNLKFKKEKELEFYFIPSLLQAPFTLRNDPDASIVHDKGDNPFYVYKNIRFYGNDTVTFSDGKIILLNGSQLTFDREVIFNSENEEFEFLCGSQLQLDIGQEATKRLAHTSFDGTNANGQMVMVTGDYIGGEGSGSAPSTHLDFINCSFQNYVGSALYIQEGRATIVNSKFTGADNFYTAAGIRVAPSARLDLRGGIFSNNDVAVDGNEAELYIGHRATSYQGYKVDDLVFSGNTIGVHAFGGYSAFIETSFEGNEVGIVALTGELDIENNAENTFQENRYAVVFSDRIGLQRGKNLFINNEVDIAYYLPEETQTSQFFDMTCNYWQHRGITGSPVVEINAQSEAVDSVVFSYIPYLERKGNENYTCTGRKSTVAQNATFSNNTQFSDPTPYHQYLENIQAEASMVALQPLLDDELIYGYYNNRIAPIKQYHQSVAKNALVSYLNKSIRNIKEFREGMEFFGATQDVQDKYFSITQDKVAFVRNLKGYGGNVPVPMFDIPISFSKIFAYPNPTTDELNIELDVPEDGTYRFELLDIKGAQHRVLDNIDLEKGYFFNAYSLSSVPPGIYMLSVRSDNQIFVVQKIIKR